MNIKLITTAIMTLMLTFGTSAKEENNSDRIVEVVIWKTNSNFTEEEVLHKARVLNKFIENQKGFISRDLSKSEEGEWLDLVYWSSIEDANAAAKLAQSCEICQPFFDTIDMSSMKFYHFKSQFKFKNIKL
jgi:hypothetical protein